jgi:hypothetical protein
MCGLTEEEVLAVAEHEHLPEVAATALPQYLLSREHGSEQIRDMIVDDIREVQCDPTSCFASFPHHAPGSEAT